MGSHLYLWAVVCVGRWLVSLLIVVGRVVVVIGGVILWWLWWLMEEMMNVTHCDISMMFELTCEQSFASTGVDCST